MSRSKTGGQKFTAAQRRINVVTMRQAGYRQKQIAEQLGVGIGTVNRDLKSALEEVSAAGTEKAQEYRDTENLRLEALLKSYWQKAVSGNLAAAKFCLSVHDKIVHLNGLAKPEKIAPTTPDGEQPYQPQPEMSDEDVAARINEILERARARRAKDISGQATIVHDEQSS